MKQQLEALEKNVVRKTTLRIVPFIFLLYIIAYLDRVNISYTALEMNAEIGLSAEAFGFISGIFFIGYFIFEIPSNILLKRFGTNRWIARIMVSWGIIVILEGFVVNGTQLAILRFLLGVAEAGFAPGIILYITFWFSKKYQAKIYAYFLSAMAVSSVIGAPITTLMMDYITWFDWSSWRWVFVLQGVPAVILGIITLFYLTNTPEEANWLEEEEREWLITELAKDARSSATGDKEKMTDAFKNFNVWRLALIYFAWVVGLYGLSLWLPTIIRDFSAILTHTQIGLVAMIPYVIGALIMIYWARRSDHKRERKYHTYIPLFVAGLGLIICSFLNTAFPSMIFISMAAVGIFSFMGPFWSLTSASISATTAVIGIALINSFGNLGGFLGPFTVGFIKESTGSTSGGLLFLGIVLLLGATLILTINKKTVNRNMSTDG